MAARQCYNNPAVRCVQVKFITVLDDGTTQRHFDRILEQCEDQVGTINRVFISNTPRFPRSEETNSTIGHIELHKPRNHQLLVDMLDGDIFHGNELQAAIGENVFHGIDYDYRCKGENCDECNRFELVMHNREVRKPIRSAPKEYKRANTARTGENQEIEAAKELTQEVKGATNTVSKQINKQQEDRIDRRTNLPPVQVLQSFTFNLSGPVTIDKALLEEINMRRGLITISSNPPPPEAIEMNGSGDEEDNDRLEN